MKIKNARCTYVSLVLLLVALLAFSVRSVRAQTLDPTDPTQTTQVNYTNQAIVDSDLDGLTDEGEMQIFHTDPNKADTDGDGFSDGAEVLAGSDPLDAYQIPGTQALANAKNIANAVSSETPWPWYFSRAAALVSFALLYVSIFLVLTVRIPLLRKIFAPALALNAHGWLALQATTFALLHGILLVFDTFIGMKISAVLLPFTASYQPFFVGLGTVAFYLMLILVVTSYARKYLAYKFWRALHFLNIILYVSAVAHALNLGTDLQSGILRTTFIGLNFVLIVMVLMNILMRMRQRMLAKSRTIQDTQNTQNQVDA